MIINCTCKNAYQDKKHGEGKRVGNPLPAKVGGFRCTVCGTVRGGSTAGSESKKKG